MHTQAMPGSVQVYTLILLAMYKRPGTAQGLSTLDGQCQLQDLIGLQQSYLLSKRVYKPTLNINKKFILHRVLEKSYGTLPVLYGKYCQLLGLILVPGLKKSPE
jgi:hypothetical protein